MTKVYQPNKSPKENIAQFTIFTTVQVAMNRRPYGEKKQKTCYSHKMDYCVVNKKNNLVY